MPFLSKTTFAFIAVLAMAVGFSPAADAQQKKPAAQAPAQTTPQPAAEQRERKPVLVKIAVLDIDRIRAEASALVEVRKQIEKYRSNYKTSIQKDEDELRKANEELTRKRQILAPEAFEDERRKFEQRFVDVQRKVQQLRQALEKTGRASEADVQKVLNEIVAQVANESDLTLILRSDQIVFLATDLDITSVVLQRLNKRLPTVKVPDPGAK